MKPRKKHQVRKVPDRFVVWRKPVDDLVNLTDLDGAIAYARYLVEEGGQGEVVVMEVRKVVKRANAPARVTDFTC